MKLCRLEKGKVVETFPVNANGLAIGRLGDNDVIIDEDVVSGHHARLQIREEGGRPCCYLVDLGSTNSTFVNDAKVGEQRLRNDDVVRVGWVLFKFVDESDQDFERTKKIHKSWIPGVYIVKDQDKE